MNRRKIAPLLLVAVLLSACASLEARNATPEVRYYAALADYNAAKVIAANYAEAPGTPVEHIEAILDIIEPTDARIKLFEQIRAMGAADTDRYEVLIAALQLASRLLEQYAVKEGALQ